MASEEERELMLAQSIEWLKSYVDGNGSVAEDFAATLIFRHREMQSLEKYTAVLAEQLDSANERVRHYITKTDDLTKQLAEYRDAHIWAKTLATLLREKHYPENGSFELLPDLLGVLTQIDNMTSALPPREVNDDPQQ